MSRRLRLEYPGAIYHIMNRGDRREPIFLDPNDYQSFLSTLEEACIKTEWQVHAYCLLPNHFHLALETPRSNLVDGMKWLLGTYTIRFNCRHQLTGHLFAGRYKALPVSGRDRYLATLGDYIHLNPGRANLLSAEEPLKQYVWSSFPAYLEPPSSRPGWLRTDRLLGECGIPKDSAAGRHEYERRLEYLRAQDSKELIREIEGNWYLGDETFKRELLVQVDEKAGAFHFGPERFESEEQLAKNLLDAALEEKGLTEAALKAMAKGHPDKVELAKWIRSRTTMTLQWVADRLQMGTKTHLVHLLYWDGREKPKARVRRRRGGSGGRGKGVGEQPDTTILLTDPMDPRFD